MAQVTAAFPHKGQRYINTMTADDLVTQGDRKLAAVLTTISYNSLTPASVELIYLFTTKPKLEASQNMKPCMVLLSRFGNNVTALIVKPTIFVGKFFNSLRPSDSYMHW